MLSATALANALEGRRALNDVEAGLGRPAERGTLQPVAPLTSWSRLEGGAWNFPTVSMSIIYREANLR